MLKNNIAILILLLFSFHEIQAQLSKKHFIPPLTYVEIGNANPENQYFYISTPSNNSDSSQLNK